MGGLRQVLGGLEPTPKRSSFATASGHPDHLTDTIVFCICSSHLGVMFDIAATMNVMLRMSTTSHVLIDFALLMRVAHA